MKQLHANIYYSGHIGLSNARMSAELAIVMGVLSNREVILYGKEPVQHSTKRLDELFDLPAGVQYRPHDEINPNYHALPLWQEVVHTTMTVPEGFSNGRKVVFCGSYRQYDDIRTPNHFGMGFYSNLFYLYGSEKETAFRRTKELTPKALYYEVRNEIVWKLTTDERFDGEFNSVHIRRGDKNQQDKIDIPAEVIAQRLRSVFSSDKLLLIHSDEEDRSWFEPILAYFPHTLFAEDLIREAKPELDPAEQGIVSQLIAARSADFIGTLGSTFTAYIQRHRVYEKKAPDFKFLYGVKGIPLNEQGYMVGLPVSVIPEGAASWAQVNMGQASNIAFWLREWPEFLPASVPVPSVAAPRTAQADALLAGEPVFEKRGEAMYIHHALTATEQSDLIILMNKSPLQDESHDVHYNNSFGWGFFDPERQTVDSLEVDAAVRKVFKKLTKGIEDLAGVPLAPSGCYGRVYKKGSYLKAHVDRPDLEFTASICLVAPDNDWHLFMETADSPIAISIKSGDAAVMNGTKYNHWRQELFCDEDDMAMYIFFHWKRKELPKPKEPVLIGEKWLLVEDQFLSEAEVNTLMGLLEKEEFVPAMVKEHVDGAPVIRQNPAVRSNKTTQSDNHSPELKSVIQSVREKIADRIGVEVSRFEKMQVLKYGKGQYFSRHTDCPFTPENDREYTAMVYLNTVEEGGHTNFPIRNVSVAPVQGRLLVWKNMMNGVCIPESTHEGMPVLKGKKFVLVDWILQKEPEHADH